MSSSRDKASCRHKDQLTATLWASKTHLIDGRAHTPCEGTLQADRNLKRRFAVSISSLCFGHTL